MSARPTLLVLAAGRARRFGGVKPLAPIGPHHEAVIDLLVSDAVRAGFGRIVLVLNPDSGPQIHSHVEATWPPELEVSYATQDRSLGTVHAVLCARDHVDPTSPFAVVNADDLYGLEALTLMAEHLVALRSNCLVAFRLHNAIVGHEPVTRGVCTVVDGKLVSIVERRHVVATDDAFFSRDGLEPESLDPESIVSMNLWGFSPDMWDVFSAAMAQASDASEDAEVLLPELVGRVLSGDLHAADELKEVEAMVTDSRCIGITHPGDLEVVRNDLRQQIERGERASGIFTP